MASNVIEAKMAENQPPWMWCVAKVKSVISRVICTECWLQILQRPIK